MGTQFLIETRTMKFLVVLALVAAAYAAPEAEANAEAEPWWYSNYGGWGGYRYASPYWNRGYAYASPYYRGYWKRDAEAWYSNWYGRRWGGWGYGYRPYGYGAYGYGRWWQSTGLLLLTKASLISCQLVPFTCNFFLVPPR